MSHPWRALAVLALIALSAPAGHGQDGDPFAEPPPPAPPAAPARQEQPQPSAAPETARPALRVRGVSVVAGRPPAALLEAGGGSILVRAGDVFAAPVGAALVECKAHDIAPGAVRVGLVGTELTWVVR